MASGSSWRQTGPGQKWIPPSWPPPVVPTSWLPEEGLAGAAAGSTSVAGSDASDRPVERIVPVRLFGQTTTPAQGDPLLAQVPTDPQGSRRPIFATPPREAAAMGAMNAASHPLGYTPSSATSSAPATDMSFAERHVTTKNRMGFLQPFQQPAHITGKGGNAIMHQCALGPGAAVPNRLPDQALRRIPASRLEVFKLETTLDRICRVLDRMELWRRALALFPRRPGSGPSRLPTGLHFQLTVITSGPLRWPRTS